MNYFDEYQIYNEDEISYYELNKIDNSYYFNNIEVSYSNLFGTSFFTFIVYPFIWGIFEIFRRMTRSM